MNNFLPSFFGRFFLGQQFVTNLLFITGYFNVNNKNIIFLSMVFCNVLYRFLKMKIN